MDVVVAVLKELNSKEHFEIENAYETRWICQNCFMWVSGLGILDLTVCIETHDIHTVDVYSDKITIRDFLHTYAKDFPMIRSEEEYFQYSLLHDLTGLPLELFLECDKLYNKISTIVEKL